MVVLEHFEPADFKQLIEWISDEQLLTNWSGSLFNYPLTKESLDWYLEGTNDLQKSDALVYKAVDTKTGTTVGHISLGSISRKNRSARISRVLVGNTCERGRGTCQSMITAILKVGFEEVDLHRISLGVYSDNKAAIRCYEKAGFVIEGLSRDVLKVDDTYWSMYEMSILEHEWHNLRQAKKQANQ
jgi:RimJ/RimL family protein N-acetyltransferase